MTIEKHMLHALHLAQQAQGQCAPNPCVGAVLVRSDEVIAQGYHHSPGKPHAEIEVLQQAGNNAKGASMYVTLEPCCHYGRTPPCTQAIIDAGVREVIYAFLDPNPQVAGKGAQQLQQAGIDVRKVSLKPIDEFYQAYQYWWQHQQPWVTLKLAMSLDGKIADTDGRTAIITGSDCQRFTHQQRHDTDAILTSVKTIIKDNPQLNARLTSDAIAKPIYIIDSALAIPEHAHIWSTAKNLTLLHSERVTTAKTKQLEQKGARCIAVAENQSGLDLAAVLKIIGRDGMHNVWVEAGGRLSQALLEQRFVQRAYFYIAAKSLGEQALTGLSKAINFSQQVKQIHWQSMGVDAICQLDW